MAEQGVNDSRWTPVPSGHLRAARDLVHRVDTILDSISDALFLTSLDGVIVYANSAANDLLDDGKEGLLDRQISDLANEELGQLVQGTAHGGLGTAVRRFTHGARELEARTSVVFEGGVEPIGAVTVLHDISDLRALDRMKDDLLSTVNHELRTPLTSLRGFAELLYERELPREEQKTFLQIMLQETKRLTNLINDFLDIQRVEANAMIFRREDVDDLPSLLHEAAAGFVLQRNDDHEIIVDVDGAFPVVSIDCDRIRQVVINLLSNAIKFSPDGGRVHLRARAANGGVRIDVEDEGIGIPDEAKSELFGKFFRVDNGATRQAGGSGLGLALVKELIAAHGGEVFVKSTLGEGSIFSFTLPAKRDPGPPHE